MEINAKTPDFFAAHIMTGVNQAEKFSVST